MKVINVDMKNLSLAILLLISSVVWAQPQTISFPTYFSHQENNQGHANILTPITYGTPELGRNAYNLREKTVDAKLYLKLDVGDDYVTIDGETFTYTLDLDIWVNGVSFTNKTITITDKAPEKIALVNLLNEFTLPNTVNSITIQPSINSILTFSGTLVENYIKQKVRLTTTLVRSYAVDTRLPSGVMSSPVTLNAVGNQSSRLVNFTWIPPANTQYPNYELQLLRLYNTNNNLTGNSTTIEADIDWSKALRVETQSHKTNISLTVAEGTGYYLWRVRPIGNYFPGGIANQENYGRWNNSSLAQGATINLPGQTSSGVFFLTDPDEDINWIYNRVFTEGNADPSNSKVKVSEGMSYADGLLRARQTQAYNSSNTTTLVTQTVSDYSGRPALTTLPVPVIGNLSGYKIGFVKNQGGTLYTAADYDLDDVQDNVSDPQQIEQSSTAFSYYDGTHTDGVANAEGYPYKRTLFKTDGTGRVDEESGVGKMHALGSQSGPGGGKTTRILFGTPSDDELIRIFGDEAPLAESVIKTITFDPNDVVSTTYTSKEGKTIATALMTTPTSTTNLKALDGEAPLPLSAKNSANQNIYSNQKMISSRRIALEQDKTVTLSYKVVNETSFGGCVGGNCELRVRFYLTDLKNNVTYSSDDDATDLNGINSFVLPASTSLDFTSVSNWGWVEMDPLGTTPFTGNITNSSLGAAIDLKKGEYILTKEVYSANGENFAEEAIIAYSEKYEPILNAIADQMNAIVNSTGYAAFDTYLNDLKTLLDAVSRDNTAILLHLGLVQGVNVPNAYIVPADFDLTAMVTDPNDPSQNNFTVTIGDQSQGSGCCPPITIPVPKPEICIACEATTPEYTFNGIDYIRDNSTNLNYGSTDWNAINTLVEDYFMDYLYRRLFDENFISNYDPDNPSAYVPDQDLQDVLDRFAPGFTAESFQYMITNMLVSKYYTGQKKEDPNAPGSYYRAKENENGWLTFVDANGDLNNTGVGSMGEPTGDLPVVAVTGINDGDQFNYDDCRKVYECWMQAVDLINAFEFDGDVNIMDAFNDEQGSNSSEDHYDDANSKEGGEGGGGLLGAVVNWVISQKMRSFQNSAEGEVPAVRMEAMVSLPNLFMECVGYQYAEILDEYTPLPSDYSVTVPMTTYVPSGITVDNFTTVYNGNTQYGTLTPFLVERDPNDPNTILNSYEINCGAPCAQEKVLFYPYVLKPEWMFKYFVYNAFSNDQGLDDNIQVLSQFQTEVATCYNDMFVHCGTGSSCTSMQRCNGEECRYYHDSWSAAQRLNFYKMISGGRKCPESCNPINNNNNTPDPLVCDKQETVEQALLELAEIKSYCAMRANEFKAAIKQELLANCYEIVPCKLYDYQITEAQIDLMVAGVVASCEGQVVTIEDDLNKLYNHIIDPIQYPTNTSVNYGVDLELEFPKCILEDCCELKLTQTGVSCEPNTYRTIIYFPDCDQVVLDQVSRWEFNPQILATQAPQDVNPNCTPGSNKEWYTGTTCTSSTCNTQDCTHLNPAGTTYSSTINQVDP